MLKLAGFFIGGNMLKNIRIVLVETTHSGNIGSTARAMKTMGLSQLVLVNPKVEIDQQAIALAAGADDLVKQARIVPTFEQAIEDCGLVIGTSARLRNLQNSLIEPRECGLKAIAMAKQMPVAIVFGRERVGLHNDELLKCQFHLTIPANPDYSSLNLAMAVQLVCYELRMAYLADTKDPVIEIDNNNQGELVYPNQQQLEYFFNRTEQLYQKLGFIQNQAVMPKVRRFYQRAKLEQGELNFLQGMLTAVEKRLK